MYPENVRIFIDGKDVTEWLFGEDTITPTIAKHSWTNIDITQFVKARGKHVIEVTCEAGVGRVELIVEIA
jgi:protein-tyrosine phosphatase